VVSQAKKRGRLLAVLAVVQQERLQAVRRRSVEPNAKEEWLKKSAGSDDQLRQAAASPWQRPRGRSLERSFIPAGARPRGRPVRIREEQDLLATREIFQWRCGIHTRTMQALAVANRVYGGHFAAKERGIDRTASTWIAESPKVCFHGWRWQWCPLLF